MTSLHNRSSAIILSRSWLSEDESAFVLRTVAASLSRRLTVEIWTPGSPATTTDGLFDIHAIGGDTETWPEREGDANGTWRPPPTIFIADSSDLQAQALARRVAPMVPVLGVGVGAELDPSRMGIPVPVNPLVRRQPHNGFGFSDYVLVLTDRSGPNAHGERTDPTPIASWIIARFPRLRTIVVEDAEASAYWGRALRGVVHIDTRTDLQRLFAHARLVVDLLPGHLIARECLEALKLGTPILVPAPSVAAHFVQDGRGRCFENVADLLEGVELLSDPEPGAEFDPLAQERFNEGFTDVNRFIRNLWSKMPFDS